jgi:hypothetical protein
MDDHAGSNEERALSAQLDLDLDRQPISGRLRTAWGADEEFVGWLGFVDALKRLREGQAPSSEDPAAHQPPAPAQERPPPRKEPR